MRLLLAFFLLIVFWSCSNLKEKINTDVQSDSSNQTSLTSEIRAESNLPQNADLPFGPSILVNYKFPKEWSNREEDNHPKEQLHIKKLSETQEFFNQLNTVKSIKSPSITEIEFIRLKDFQDSLLFSIDSIKYRLPNFGPYECYYSWVDVKRPHEEEKDYEERSDELIETGNLILYEPKTKKPRL